VAETLAVGGPCKITHTPSKRGHVRLTATQDGDTVFAFDISISTLIDILVEARQADRMLAQSKAA
jgi:hypothetical protein